VSDTPLTDDLARGNHVVPTEFAQKLERDIHNLQDQRDFAMGVIQRLERERDEAREAFTIATINCTEAQQRLRAKEASK
jgi:hypothetical protein